MMTHPRPGAACAGLALLLLTTAGGGVQAQTILDLDRDPVLPRDFDPWNLGGDNSNAARPNRIRLFRMMPGFISDPTGLDLDDGKAPDPDAKPARAEDDGPSWVQFTLGNDNPFFDIRRPGDPGGVGYYRVNSQLQIIDSKSTAFTFGFQAFTPAGLESGGVENGATVVSPALGLFHTLDDGTAFHGFVGKNMNLNTSALTQVPANRSVQCGVAVQRPLLPAAVQPDGSGSVYWFVEALGRYHYDATQTGAAPIWEVVPGMQWKVNEAMFISGGVSLPVTGDQPVSARLWQITCQFKF